ncbi:MAG: hypothetical protein DRJ03_03400 [Chloroflexi bacterium]|nr:MAG: hypothetical protein DRJ03_03400 [Chloroflexota bacterium]
MGEFERLGWPRRGMSCAADYPDEARKAILCELIDKFDGEFYNDWDGRPMTRQEAKEYIMNYGKPVPPSTGGTKED